MLLTLDAVLDETLLQAANRAFDAAPFVDGRASAGADAAAVKHNHEVPADSPAARRLGNALLSALDAHPAFQAAAMPLRMSAAVLARYAPGMHYGAHTDDPVMGPAGGRYRCDLAVTLFLNAPRDYDGGELRVQTAFGEQCVKLAAGAAVLYPASSLHSVAPVRAGERRVAVTWVQSMVRAAEQRQVLYDLWSVRESLRTALPRARVTGELDRAYTNLVRMWAEL